MAPSTSTRLPRGTAQQKVLEETGLIVDLDGIVTVLGGPEFRSHYKKRRQKSLTWRPFTAELSLAVSLDRTAISESRPAEWFAFGVALLIAPR